MINPVGYWLTDGIFLFLPVYTKFRRNSGLDSQCRPSCNITVGGEVSCTWRRSDSGTDIELHCDYSLTGSSTNCSRYIKGTIVVSDPSRGTLATTDIFFDIKQNVTDVKNGSTNFVINISDSNNPQVSFNAVDTEDRYTIISNNVTIQNPSYN